ncbi:DNA polymerase III subunit epsilon [Streptomyces sp. YIM 121038]|uniref:DNA polymerase III subunit epsilon n=1 Tax=Streptomyces sp. YIM 121038 TaxID=2136401 RepID=UPI001110F846|nr:DNA polymerase III subunit epsilon [Streptomyces sp. YIM 121038]
MAALDFECSDKVPETARIVSCALILVGGGLDTNTRTWLVNPGVAQEPGAIAVHKLTDEHLSEHGAPAAQAVADIAKSIAEVVAAGVPIVGHNIGSFDLNLLNHECLRHLGDGLEGILRQPLTRVIDTMVIDRHVAPYRRRVSETQGPYQMRTTAETYGLAWDEAAAHGAEYDALQSARAAYRMGAIAHQPRAERPVWVHRLRAQRFDALAGVSVDDLHLMQQAWAKEQAAGFQEWLRCKAPEGKRDPQAVVDGRWPLVPAPRQVGED